ncbi:MAG: phosphoglycerate transporter protein PgtP [Verrucomicrobiota bacterium]|nr:phosphoglycerate transporter protein PgtP [Verrucomicrobiota bacterium]
MNLFQFLRPAPYAKELEDQELVKKNYRYWRLRTFFAMYIGYAFFYFTRKSFTFAMPALQTELGLGKFELGLLGSMLSLTYGASKFISGILGDKSNPRYFMSIGLILTGIFNILFGMSSALWALALFWGLNGWFQGWGWPGCAKLLTHWYSHSERGRWWSIWNTSHNLGGAVIPLLIAFCLDQFGWRYAMFIPGTLSILAGFYLMSQLRDTPQSLGLPPIEKFRNDYAEGSRVEKEELTTKEILWEYVLRNKYIWILAFAYFFIYVIRTAINDWSMLYLVETRGYTNLTAGVCVFWFEIGGFLGSLTAGWSSDLFFKGRRTPVNVLFTLGILVLVYAFKFHSGSVPVLDSIFLFLFGFCIFGPQMLIGVAAAELSHKKAAATATGFAGCFAYLGAATAGAPLGAVTKTWGWNSFLVAICICAAMAVLLLLPLWSVKTNPKEMRVKA